MKYLYCYLEKIGEVVVGAVMLLIGILFFIFGFTTLVPIVSLFLAVPIIALSFRFFGASLSKTCSLPHVYDDGPGPMGLEPSRRESAKDQMLNSANLCKGVALMLIATFSIVLMTTCAKMSSLAHDPIEMVFYRGLVALSLLVPYMLRTGSLSVFKTKRFNTHLYRSVIGNVGIDFVFWAYTLLPMADATALLFAAPLVVTALSSMMLKEKVDRYRWIAVVIGFGGILLIAKPSSGLLSNPATLVGLAAVFCRALVFISLRTLDKTDDVLTTVFYFFLIGVLISAPYTFFYGSGPDMGILPWIVGIGFFSVLQQLAKTKAFQLAEASLLAPYTYTSIVWATLTGWIFWKDFPTLSVLAGATVVIGSNLFSIWWERQKSRSNSSCSVKGGRATVSS